MNLNLSIMLDAGESPSNLPGDAEHIAQDVLIAAGGDPAKDTCTVSITTQTSGGVGPLSPPE